MEKFLFCFDLKTGCLWLGKMLIPISIITILVSIFKLYTALQISCEHLDRIVITKSEFKNYKHHKRWKHQTDYDICEERKERKNTVLNYVHLKCSFLLWYLECVMLYVGLILFMLLLIPSCTSLINGIKSVRFHGFVDWKLTKIKYCSAIHSKLNTQF